MPKSKSIGVSNETLELVKAFQKDINAKSLDETVRLAVGWGRSFNSDFLVSQVELNDRLNAVEGMSKSNASWIVNMSVVLNALSKDFEKIKKDLEN